jgi:hypothetical protein
VNAQDFLSRLEKVRQTAPGEWVARCPGHLDKTPSLAVKEADDGRILVKCFAGCSFNEICDGAGVKPEEMFPDTNHATFDALERLAFNPRTMLHAMQFNAMVLSIIASDMAAGEPITPEDKETAFRISEELEEVVRAISR